MARVTRTAFDLLGQLEDEEDVENAEFEAPQPEPKEPAPRMPPRPVRPAAPPRPRPPPDVTDRLTRQDYAHTKMCKHYLEKGRCDLEVCFYAHSKEEHWEANQRLRRRMAEERANLGWVPPPTPQHHHIQYDTAPEGAPAAAHSYAGPSSSSGDGSGRSPCAPRNYKRRICFHWLTKNGSCGHGDRCWFAHGELELRQYLHDEAAVLAELASHGMQPQLGPVTPPLPPSLPPSFGHASPQHATWQQQQQAPPYGGAPPAAHYQQQAPPYGAASPAVQHYQQQQLYGHGRFPPPPPAPPKASAASVGAVPISGTALAEYLSTAAQLDDDEDDVPDAFQCPITQVLLDDPVVAADGFSYERHAIEAWLASKGTSPMTGEPLADQRLVPNHTLVAAIRAVVGDHACAGRRME